MERESIARIWALRRSSPATACPLASIDDDAAGDRGFAGAGDDAAEAVVG
jgi:hypothetical protein